VGRARSIGEDRMGLRDGTRVAAWKDEVALKAVRSYETLQHR
jgi:hypothetical protein